jgi:hypothetical protein
MKLIIAGGRDYQFTDEDKAWLDRLHAEHTVEVVVSGHAGYLKHKLIDGTEEIFGADLCGEQWARSNGLDLIVMKADWNAHGKAAGPIRNEEMAKVATAVALFPGNRGTASMRSIAKRYGLKIFERVSDE